MPKPKFQPGNNFGKGRPLIPEDLKSVKCITKDEAERLLTKHMGMGQEELEAMLVDHTIPALHKIVARIILKAAEFGDTQRMEFLFNRTIGKVLEKVEVHTPKPFVIKKPNGDLVLGIKTDEDEN